MDNRSLFLRYLGQTSLEPLALEIVKAEGAKLWDADGREFIDLIGGISVCNVGHRHPKILEAVYKQLDAYLHIMVYGELIQSPQVKFAKLLVENLPPSLNNVFFTASGSEATEGAMKLAKRSTGRTGIVAFNNSYHGSTQGSLSLIGDEYWRNAFRPLLPGVSHLQYNSLGSLEQITINTACVVAETIQAEAGVLVPQHDWLKALAERCRETGALLVLDEIQSGFGRNGTLWAFEQFEVIPDILLLGKALGGGMPLGAFIADKKLMNNLTENPVLGHINTFGGHPVSCAAGMAALNALVEENIINEVFIKEKLFLASLIHSKIKSVRSRGLMIAVELEDHSTIKKLIGLLMAKGVFTDWFLFAPNCFRIVPPLNISDEEISLACAKIRVCLDEI